MSLKQNEAKCEKYSPNDKAKDVDSVSKRYLFPLSKFMAVDQEPRYGTEVQRRYVFKKAPPDFCILVVKAWHRHVF